MWELSKEKRYLVIARILFSQVYQAEYLTNADQAIAGGLVEDYISGRTKTATKSWFSEVGLSISDSILSLLSLTEEKIRI